LHFQQQSVLEESVGLVQYHHLTVLDVLLKRFVFGEHMGDATRSAYHDVRNVVQLVLLVCETDSSNQQSLPQINCLAEYCKLLVNLYG